MIGFQSYNIPAPAHSPVHISHVNVPNLLPTPTAFLDDRHILSLSQDDINEDIKGYKTASIKGAAFCV